MSIFFKLTLRGMLKNKKRTLSTLFGVMLSVALMCAIITLLTSVVSSMVDSIIEKNGNWHVAVHGLTEGDASDILFVSDMESFEYQDGVLYICLSNPQNTYEFAESQLAGYEYSFNSELLSCLGVTNSESIRDMIVGIGSVLLAVIVTSAVALIYNSFAISVSERTRQTALLSSIGATPGNIRRMIYSEAIVVGVVGIIPGIALGIGSSAMLLGSLGKYLTKITYTNVAMKLYVSPLTVAASALLAMLVVIASVVIPSRRASRISVIDIIRQSREFKLGKRKRKYRSLLGLEGVLAKKNAARNKGKYRVIVFSLSMSILLVVAAVSFGDYTESLIDTQLKNIGYDIKMNVSDPSISVEGLCSDISKIDTVEDIAFTTDTTVNILLSKSDIDSDYYENYRKDESYAESNVVIVILPDERFNTFAVQNSINIKEYYDTVNLKAMCIGKHIVYDADDEVELDIFKAKSVKNVRLRSMSEDAAARYYADFEELMMENPSASLPEEEYYDIFVDTPLNTGVTEVPMELISLSERLTLIIPKSMSTAFSLPEPDGYEVFIKSANYKQVGEIVEAYLSENGLSDKVNVYIPATSYESQRNTAMLLKFLSIALVCVMTVIAAASVFNTITTDLAVRKRELALYRSIGMTNTDIMKLLCYENILQCVRAVLLGFLLSLPITYALYKSIVIGVAVSYKFPFGAFTTVSVGIIVVTLLILLIGLRGAKNDNIIESLRNENV